MTTQEFFPGIGKIKFEGKESKNPLAFRFYDAEKVVYGKKMKDWFKFSVAWWHTLCADGGDPFGPGTKSFPWTKGAGIGTGIYKDNREAFASLEKLAVIQPEAGEIGETGEAYNRWRECLI